MNSFKLITRVISKHTLMINFKKDHIIYFKIDLMFNFKIYIMINFKKEIACLILKHTL